MRIEAELRRAITAASRQSSKSTESKKVAMRQALDEFALTPRGKKMMKEGIRLIKEINALDKKKKALQAQLVEVTYPAGIRLSENVGIGNKVTTYQFWVNHGDESLVKFQEAGGKLPPPGIREWHPDEVIARVSAAKTKKEASEILARYGIHWD